MTSRTGLLASTAVALLMCAAPVGAQTQPKGSEEKAAPSQPGKETGGEPRVQRTEPAEKAAPPAKAKGTSGKDQPGKGTAQTEPREKGTKGAADKSAEPKATKGAAEKSAEPKATKGAAEKGTEPKATKGAAEKSAEPKATKGTAEKDSAGRLQLSEQQRTNVGQTIIKDRSVNRVTVNVSIGIGTRVPRSVRLAALPASVITIAPAYRSYRYFVVDDRICIVDPDTYEIVEIITISDQTARTDRAPAALVLTEEERTIILSEVDKRDGSTLALGSLTEGADIPRGVQLRAFPDRVVQRVPKVKGYRFFTAENRIVIADQQGSKVELVIEGRR